MSASLGSPRTVTISGDCSPEAARLTFPPAAGTAILPAVQVSFIIPLYNCLELTRTCVESLQRSIPAGLVHEIILVDDGSTDGTRAWLAGLGAPFRVLLNERNLGYAGANNRGVAQATGSHLMLLNNDLEFHRGWLEPMFAVAKRLGPQAGLIGNVQRNARTGQIDHAGMRINAKGKPEHRSDAGAREAFWPGYRPVPAVTAACVLVARETWNTLGGFDEGFRNGGEDVDLCFKAASRGLINAVALRSVVLHHVSASPGRKLRDEQNSYRLARRWRSVLCGHAARAWCHDYLEREVGPGGRQYPLQGKPHPADPDRGRCGCDLGQLTL